MSSSQGIKVDVEKAAAELLQWTKSQIPNLETMQYLRIESRHDQAGQPQKFEVVVRKPGADKEDSRVLVFSNAEVAAKFPELAKLAVADRKIREEVAFEAIKQIKPAGALPSRGYHSNGQTFAVSLSQA